MTAAVRLALQYRPGRRVTVWYNPAEPSEAVLERGAGVANVVGVAVGLGILWVGLHALFR